MSREGEEESTEGRRKWEDSRSVEGGGNGKDERGGKGRVAV